jgi:hypothetical protein
VAATLLTLTFASVRRTKRSLTRSVDPCFPLLRADALPSSAFDLSLLDVSSHSDACRVTIPTLQIDVLLASVTEDDLKDYVWHSKPLLASRSLFFNKLRGNWKLVPDRSEESISGDWVRHVSSPRPARPLNRSVSKADDPSSFPSFHPSRS